MNASKTDLELQELNEIILEKFGSFELFKPFNLFIGQFVDYKILDNFRIRDIEEQLSHICS